MLKYLLNCIIYIIFVLVKVIYNNFQGKIKIVKIHKYELKVKHALKAIDAVI